MKMVVKALISGFVISVICSCLGFFSRCDSISGKIFRLHIIANSDSAEDQALKLKVRDRILSDVGVELSAATDVIGAEHIAEGKLEEIENIAQDEVFKNGY
ncbi:MAG: stage II sporulation protein R, partial [Clostridia bacterium]|nr:stage II sporulation protein R [Clostridia bacterium]